MRGVKDIFFAENSNLGIGNQLSTNSMKFCSTQGIFEINFSKNPKNLRFNNHTYFEGFDVTKSMYFNLLFEEYFFKKMVNLQKRETSKIGPDLICVSVTTKKNTIHLCFSLSTWTSKNKICVGLGIFERIREDVRGFEGI